MTSGISALESHRIPVIIAPNVTLTGHVPANLSAATICTHCPVSRGSAYHYTGCGCGSRPWCGSLVDWMWYWQSNWSISRPAASSSRPVSDVHTTFQTYPREFVEDEVTSAIHRLQTWSNVPVESALILPTGVADRAKPVIPLRVAYLIPHHNVTGGMKMIMKQIEFLHARGNWVRAVYRGRPEDPVLPPWASDVEVDDKVLLGMEESMLKVMEGVDVLMIGYFTQLIELKDVVECPGPIVYWDQGHEHIFGDAYSADPHWDVVFHLVMQLPIVLLSVSHAIRTILESQFSRVAPIVPNAIDCGRFVVSDAQRRIASDTSAVKRVLIVGHPGLPLKNFTTALSALNYVHSKHKGLEVTWMCQAKPECDGVTFPIHTIVSPAQTDIPSIYQRGYHALLFASHYEAWGMPVMEAMASGIPVVTSACMGVDMFCHSGFNCLMVAPTDTLAMAKAVCTLIENTEYAARLAENGRAIVAQFTWDRAATLLEDALLVTSYLLGTSSGCLRFPVEGDLAPDTPKKTGTSETLVAASKSPMVLTPMMPSMLHHAVPFPPLHLDWSHTSNTVHAQSSSQTEACRTADSAPKS